MTLRVESLIAEKVGINNVMTDPLIYGVRSESLQVLLSNILANFEEQRIEFHELYAQNPSRRCFLAVV